MGRRLSVSSNVKQKELVAKDGRTLCLSTMDLEMDGKPQEESKSDSNVLLGFPATSSKLCPHFLLCSSVIHEEHHEPNFPAQCADHVYHSAPSFVLHGGHEQRSGVPHGWRPKHRSVGLSSSLNKHFLRLKMALK